MTLIVLSFVVLVEDKRELDLHIYRGGLRDYIDEQRDDTDSYIYDGTFPEITGLAPLNQFDFKYDMTFDYTKMADGSSPGLDEIRKCVPCDVGRYGDEIGKTFDDPYFEVCKECPDGRYNKDPTGVTECEICPAGYLAVT